MITGGDELLANHHNCRFCFSNLHRRIFRPVDWFVRCYFEVHSSFMLMLLFVAIEVVKPSQKFPSFDAT